LLLAWAAAARAHDVWLMPESFRPAAGDRVAVRLFVGERFAGQELARNARLVDRFWAIGPRGDSELSGAHGLAPAGLLTVRDAGAHLVTYRSHGGRIELPAAQFEAYLLEEGLERIVELRRERGQSEAPAREAFARCAQTLLWAGGLPAPPPGPAGCPFELALESDPSATAAPGELTLRALLRGDALAGARVVALPQGAPERAVSGRSGEDGRVVLPLAEGGVWLVKAVHMEAADDQPGIDWQSWWASVTFSLGEEGD
ncbi:MAG: DUF4198 domain-containing protein, partial [Thermoanaerobaculia bacterium]|nr:DUF4198 domain-containing protein [Thermoanaerobaculia bacterium]